MNLEDYMKLDYPITISKITEEDATYKIEMKDLLGLAVYADSIEEGVEEIQSAKETWIETCLEIGRKVPLPKEEKKEYSGRITLRIPKSLHRELAQQSESEDLSLNQYINYIIQKGQSNAKEEESRNSSSI